MVIITVRLIALLINNTQSYFSEASRVIVYFFLRLQSIMDAISACYAFTDSTGGDAHDPIFLAASPPFASISNTITTRELHAVASREQWGLVLELIRTLVNLMSIHSHWGLETCSVDGSTSGSAGKHGVNAVQLYPVLVVESMV